MTGGGISTLLPPLPVQVRRSTGQCQLHPSPAKAVAVPSERALPVVTVLLATLVVTVLLMVPLEIALSALSSVPLSCPLTALARV